MKEEEEEEEEEEDAKGCGRKNIERQEEEQVEGEEEGVSWRRAPRLSRSRSRG